MQLDIRVILKVKGSKGQTWRKGVGIYEQRSSLKEKRFGACVVWLLGCSVVRQIMLNSGVDCCYVLLNFALIH